MRAIEKMARALLPDWVVDNLSFGRQEVWEVDSNDDDFAKVVADTPIRENVELEEANLVTSQVVAARGEQGKSWKRPLPPPNRHMPVLDLDLSCVLLDSSSKKHHHLIIGKEMPWEDYVELMEVMQKVGILQKGFVEASKVRGYSAIRTPWTKKGEEL